MQTIQELVDMGYKPHEAKIMLESCDKHIGELYGVNKVVDINYTNNHERDVKFICTLCGKESHKLFVNGRNKWSEMIHSCECQIKKNFPKIKKAFVSNSDPSFIGSKFGDYEVVNTSYQKRKSKSGGAVCWTIKCIHCGNMRTSVYPSIVKRGIRCECQTERERNELWNSRVGERYGKLVIEGFEKRGNGKYPLTYALCKCDCGSKFATEYANLTSGATKSCGCIEREKERVPAKTKSPLYNAWTSMKQRCNNPKNPSYKNYGGRGIKVCDEWNDRITGYDKFEKWAMENGYEPYSGLSLDRIDVNGNYEPSNCRYTTTYVQNANKRKRNTDKNIITLDGTSMPKAEWCKKYNISEVAVNYRMRKMGMDFETALKTPKAHVGNRFAGKQSKERVANLNKCNSYIEANLYLAFIRTTEEYKLVSQYKIGNYIADFIVEETNLVIECDGYDNHKTKEQIAHDCKRDRFMANEGYIVLRFTGSEINADPDGCANEIIESVKNICGESYENRKTYA